MAWHGGCLALAELGNSFYFLTIIQLITFKFLFSSFPQHVVDCCYLSDCVKCYRSWKMLCSTTNCAVTSRWVPLYATLPATSAGHWLDPTILFYCSPTSNSQRKPSSLHQSSTERYSIIAALQPYLSTRFFFRVRSTVDVLLLQLFRNMSVVKEPFRTVVVAFEVSPFY